MPRKKKHHHRTTSNQYDKGWNEKIELSMLRLQKKCLVYKWLFTQVAAKLHRRDKIMGIVNVFASVASGTAIFGNTSTSNMIVTIITGVVAYLLSVSLGLGAFLNYAEASENHKEAAHKFSQVAELIQRQLDVDAGDRQEAQDFVRWIEREFNTVHEASPMLSPSLLAKFEKEYGSELDPTFMTKHELNEQPTSLLVDLDQSRSSESKSSLSFGHRTKTKKSRKRQSARGSGSSLAMEASIFQNSAAENTFDEDMRLKYELDRYYQ